jgi:putative ABC transport system substrate-binding protein
MDRRTFLGTLTGGLLAAPLALEAQQAGRIPQIGFLSPSGPTALGPFVEAFVQGLRELGYVEGQSIAIEYR